MISGPRLSILRVFFACFLLALVVAAQPARRPLHHKDYDAWRTIAGQTLSRDGKFLAYSYMPAEGDGDLIVRNLATGQEWKHTVGALPPPPAPDAENPDQPPARRGVTIRFTSDGKYLVASTYPAKADTDQAKKERKRAEDMPKGGLLILDLATGAPTRVPMVKSFQVPEKGGPWLAFLKEAKPEERRPDAAKPDAARPGEEDQDQRAGARAGAAASTTSGRREYGTDLVLRDLTKGESSDRTFANALEISFARDGRTLLYTVSSRKEEDNGLFSVTPGTEAAPAALLAGKGRYTKLSWDREQKQLAFLSTKDDAESRTPAFKAYYWDRQAAAAAAVVAADTPGFPAGRVVSERGTLAFSRDGRKLYVASARPPKPEAETPAPSGGTAAPSASAAPADDKVVMDLWHWRDDFVQPMQKVRAPQERNRSYAGVYHLAEKKYVPVADERMATASMSDDGTQAIGGDDRAYRRMIDYDGTYTDYYWVDTATGQRKQLVRQIRGGGFGGGMQWSPDGKYAAFFNGGHWFLVNTADSGTRNVTASLNVAFADEEDDTPDPASSYGAAGWAKDSKSFLVNDRYDVWQIFVDGTAARMVTGGAGRKDKITFRIQRIDPVDEDDDERGIDTSQPLTLRAVSEETRETGFFRAAGGKLERLLWGAKNYAFAGRAREADVVLITASRFDEYPDLQVTNSRFAAPKKVSSGGEQMNAFLWGTSELIRFRNTDGVPLKGVLFKPAGFDAKKKYPLMVYIYERLSQGVHNFVNPGPGTSINVAYYVSNGYVVLEPDIVYTEGYPGQSALKCVLPAIDAVVDQGFIDEKAIGIQGHSWGGYQIAYMVTQTTRFRAAEAGAPVGNMTSAYSGIRWGSGMPRQFQYEKTQSRIGHPLFANPERYLQNSPIFYADRVKTPLLILHNDGDDAVPWYQGIELYLALRRNNKEAYLLNYNGEPHGIRKRVNQKDYTVRMQQFFDHHLKGAEAPEWMQKGVPFLEREEEKERFNRIYTDQR